MNFALYNIWFYPDLLFKLKFFRALGYWCWGLYLTLPEQLGDWRTSTLSPSVDGAVRFKSRPRICHGRLAPFWLGPNDNARGKGVVGYGE